MPSIIAVGNDAQVAAEFTLTDGQSSTINLRPANAGLVAIPADAVADVQLKTSDGGWVNVERLGALRPATGVQGPGTFRVTRTAGAGSFGVDRT